MTPSTPPTVSYHCHPSPEPSIFFFEAEPTFPPASSEQTLSTDSSTLYVPFCLHYDWYHSKDYSKMPGITVPRRPTLALPPPQQILTASCRPSYMICLLSAPGTHSEEDPAANERRLRVQLEWTADLLAKSIKQSAWLADEDAFEVEIVDRYPLAPLVRRKPRSLWAWCLRKALRKGRAAGRVIFCVP